MIALRGKESSIFLINVDIIYVKECGEFREIAYSHKDLDKIFICETPESLENIMEKVVGHAGCGEEK